MSNKRILIAEISGKRPGDVKARPTESFDFNYDKVIISNNSEGYDTDWEIVNVPDDYREWYVNNIKIDEKAYFAPMNRSYAIKYARENGYDYLVQLDDNITGFRIAYQIGNKSYSSGGKTGKSNGIHNDMFDYMADVLDETNAGIVGMGLMGVGVPGEQWLAERFVYSAFMMNLSRVPDYYHGDYEDDIEFRLKLKQQKTPMLCVVPFQYAKTSQRGTGDTTGNRQAYIDAGLKRGETMSKLYGDIYSRGYSDRGSAMKRKEGLVDFKHKIKPFKVGVAVRNVEFLKQRMLSVFRMHAQPKSDKLTVLKTTTE